MPHIDASGVRLYFEGAVALTRSFSFISLIGSLRVGTHQRQLPPDDEIDDSGESIVMNRSTEAALGGTRSRCRAVRSTCAKALRMKFTRDLGHWESGLICAKVSEIEAAAGADFFVSHIGSDRKS